MWHVTLAILLFAFSHTAIARQEPKAKAEPKVRTDQELIQGTWQIVGLEANGKPEPAANYKGNAITFSKDKATLREGNYPAIDFTFTLDPTKTPRAIDLTAKTVVIRGVYKLEGDDLTLSLSVGGSRPADFATKAGGESETFTLKRVPWERYSDKAFGFSVEMVGKPEERKRDAETPGGMTTTTFLISRSEMEQVTYLVSVTPLPAKLEGKEADMALVAARDAAVAEGKAKVTVESDTTFRAFGYAGRESTISLEGTDGKSKGLVRVRAFIAGDRLYVLAVAGPEDAVKAAGGSNVTRFWNSFRPAADKKGGGKG